MSIGLIVAGTLMACQPSPTPEVIEKIVCVTPTPFLPSPHPMPAPDDGSHDNEILGATVLMNFEKADGSMHVPSWLGTIVELLPDGSGKIITHDHYDHLVTDHYMFSPSDGQFWRRVKKSKVKETPIGLETRELIVPSDTMDNYYSSPGHSIPIPLGSPIPGGMASVPNLSQGDPAAIAYLAPSGFGGDHADVYHGNVWGVWENGGTAVAFVSAGTKPDYADSGDSGGGLFVNGQHCGNNWLQYGSFYGQYGWLSALNP